MIFKLGWYCFGIVLYGLVWLLPCLDMVLMCIGMVSLWRWHGFGMFFGMVLVWCICVGVVLTLF